MKPNATLIYSGGLDSTVLLFQLIEEGKHVHALSFQYGQKHGKELLAAKDITAPLLDVEHFIIHLPTTAIRVGGPRLPTQVYKKLFGGSSQTEGGINVPEGHYAEESMKQTIVPNRNMVMLSVAAAYSIANDIQHLYYAAHAGDHAIYPDCRAPFVLDMDRALEQAEWPDRRVHLHAPFLGFTKQDIVGAGFKLQVPFEKTWSCYKGETLHCGKCGTCVERREAFELAGVPDPTEYERTLGE